MTILLLFSQFFWVRLILVAVFLIVRQLLAFIYFVVSKVRTEKQKSFFIEIPFLLFGPISSPTFRIHTARVECPTFELSVNLMIF